MITEKQQQQLIKKGISDSVLEMQIQALLQGAKKTNVVRPASINDGIRRWSDKDKSRLLLFLDTAVHHQKITKFIPASGAATRMFKDLFVYLETQSITPFVERFFQHLKQFAFYPSLLSLCGEDKMNKLLEENNYTELLNLILLDKGLNLGQKPKALIPFFIEDQQVLKPIYKHIKEAKDFCFKNIDVCFSISENHRLGFEKEVKQSAFGQIKVNYTEQSVSTDAVALTSENTLLLDENEQIIFRPGGHGALIYNLNELSSNYVFIRNIDNVSVGESESQNLVYKKYLLAQLIEIQQSVFSYLEQLESVDDEADIPNLIQEITSFLKEHLFQEIRGIENKKNHEQVAYLKQVLDRPIRVCGMVKNEGEPGGGPFWVRDAKGDESLQIVETAQLDLKDDKIKAMLSEASHFNPVDMVCALKNRFGESYQLLDFVDKETYFISEKNYQGKTIRAFEYPGLWNGAMAFWNTLFVEIPIDIFNPVKTINDLILSKGNSK